MSWNIADKTVLITGGTSGIGHSAARALSQLGAKIIITSRSRQSAEKVADALSVASGNPVTGFELNLASIKSVREFSTVLSEEIEGLDVLVNNAGTIAGRRILTEDSIELTFATNFLGPFLLTQLMIPQLRNTESARILNISSELYKKAKKGLDFNNLQLDRGFSPSTAYAHSKLAMMLFTNELRRRLAGDTITAFAIHPGVVRTNFGTGSDSSQSMALMMKLLGPLLKDPDDGAETTIHLSTAPIESLHESWYWSEGKPTQPNPIALDEEAAKHLWDFSEHFTDKQ